MESLLLIQGQQIRNFAPSFDTLFVHEITILVQNSDGAIFYKMPSQESQPEYELRTGAGTPEELIIALGSAGVFSAVYQAISSYLTRNQNREITLTKGKTTITIKGHSLPDEKELLKTLAPELLPKNTKSKAKNE